MGITFGNGLVFVGVGMRALPQGGGVAQLDDDIRKHGFYYHKTLWAVRPGQGPFVVTGAEVGGSRPVRFFDGQRTQRQLRLPQPDDGWGYMPATTLLPGAGCFAFTVVGRGANYRLVFKAEFLKD